jgi:glycosyltransferase involved in cell wall biosynthesis
MSHRHILIFEPDHRGHPLEWLQHLLRQVRDQDPAPLVSLLLPDALLARLRDAAGDDLGDHVRLQALSRRECELCTHANLAMSGLARWWVMRRHLQQTGADHGHFLGLDHLSLPLACGLGVAGRTVSGILFRPSVHYHQFGNHRPSWRERLRDLRKRLLYRLMLRNPALSIVFSLDPYFADYAAAHYAHGSKVRSLADPAFPPDLVEAEPVRARWSVPGGRVTFVLFGVLTARKGTLQLLEALTRLTPDTAGRTAIVVAGVIEPELSAAVRERLDALRERRPELWLHVDDRHLAVAEIDGLLARGDVVLAPYQRFVGSSGVMLWAARTGKPLLTQDYGLLGRLVRENGLGLTVDTTDPDRLARAIARIVESGPDSIRDPAAMAAFVAARSPRHFAGDLLNGMLRDGREPRQIDVTG